jgi:hypothetical protein
LFQHFIFLNKWKTFLCIQIITYRTGKNMLLQIYVLYTSGYETQVMAEAIALKTSPSNDYCVGRFYLDYT